MLAMIFWIDTQTPAGIAIPMLYVVPTVLFVGGSRFAEPLIVAAVATILTAAGFYASPEGSPDVRPRITDRPSADASPGRHALARRWARRRHHRHDDAADGPAV